MSFPQSIDQLWIFGSNARGDSGKHSDVDILMISDLDNTDYVRNYFANKYDGKIDVAYYSYKGLLPLIDDGALFAWHLRKEAKPIYQKTKKLVKLLDNMPSYSNHIRDLNILEELLHDVKTSLLKETNSFIFDAGVLGTVIRNTAIIMNNYLGADDYSPKAPFKLGKLVQLLNLPISDIEYDFLQECRRSGERGTIIVTRIINEEKLLVLAEKICVWQRVCVNYINDKEMT